MYRANGTYYTEEHSVSFGDLVTRTSGGKTYTDFNTIANTWNDWYLIPSSRPSVAHPTFVTKFIEIPGADGMLDLTDFLAGRALYGQRQGSFNFYVDNGHEYWETIRGKIVSTIHGKRMKMRLEDDPEYYYEGRFTVGNWESGSSNSSIQISYQCEPYKIKISEEGNKTPMLWDPFNFEEDYDYYTAWPGGSNVATNHITAGTYYIYAKDYSFKPVATWVSGTATVTFGGVTQTLSSAGSKTLGSSVSGQNTLTISGSGYVDITWRGGAL